MRWPVGSAIFFWIACRLRVGICRRKRKTKVIHSIVHALLGTQSTTATLPKDTLSSTRPAGSCIGGGSLLSAAERCARLSEAESTRDLSGAMLLPSEAQATERDKEKRRQEISQQQDGMASSTPTNYAGERLASFLRSPPRTAHPAVWEAWRGRPCSSNILH